MFIDLPNLSHNVSYMFLYCSNIEHVCYAKHICLCCRFQLRNATSRGPWAILAQGPAHIVFVPPTRPRAWLDLLAAFEAPVAHCLSVGHQVLLQPVAPCLSWGHRQRGSTSAGSSGVQWP